MKMKTFAVVGNPIAQSLSPLIHRQFAKQSGIQLCYDKIKAETDDFEAEVRAFFDCGGSGLNITSPFKTRAFAMAELTTEAAQRAKAANTLWMEKGRLSVDNTDGRGLIADLKRLKKPLAGSRILLLGAGGVAAAVVDALLKEQPQRLVLSNRSMAKAECLKGDFPTIEITAFDSLHGPFDLIINQTAIQFAQASIPLPQHIFTAESFCYDLAYDLAAPTVFLAHARALGCRGVDGLGMLIEQAARSFKRWHGRMPDTSPVLDYFCSRRMV